MRRVITKNKKGLSEIVGYVLLIVFAVSMSAIVFSWLRAKVPKAEEKCPDDVSVEIISYNLQADKVLNFDLRNRGLFSINGISVRLKEGTKNCEIIRGDCNNCSRYQAGSNKLLFEEKLNPSAIYTMEIAYGEGCTNPSDIEISPMRFMEENYVLCENSIYRDKVRSS